MEATLTAPAVLPAAGYSPATLTRGLLGYALLPAVGVAALGVPTGDLPAVAHAVALGAAVPAGALLLSVPALLVGHQVLDLRSSPSAVVGALGRVFLRVGEVALGLCPALALFTLTTGTAPTLMLAALAALGVVFLVLATRALNREEARIGAELLPALKMRGLALAWAGLVGLVGMRLLWDLAVATLTP